MAITLDGTTGLSSVDGSAASPSVRGTDANSGIIYSADEVKISTGGTERLRVASSGQLGIAGANYGTDGQVLTSTGASSAPAWEAIAAGIATAEQWRLTANVQANADPLTGWEKVDTAAGGSFGPTMSESSGIWTFPTTGFWLILFHLQARTANNTQGNTADIRVTTNNSSYTTNANAIQGIYDYGIDSFGSSTAQAILDITDTSNIKVKLSFGAGQGGEYAIGSSTYSYTSGIFIRLGDT